MDKILLIKNTINGINIFVSPKGYYFIESVNGYKLLS